MLDLQAEQHDGGQSCADLYEAVLQLKRRYDLHPCAVRPRDGLSLRRDSEREIVQDLAKRFRDLPVEQRRRLPALLNSLAQLEVVVGDLELSQHDFQEVARLVADPISQAEAHHNVYRAALERRDWDVALAALRRAVALDAEQFEPFPFACYEPQRLLGAGGFGATFLCRTGRGARGEGLGAREETSSSLAPSPSPLAPLPHGRQVVVKALRLDSIERDGAALFRETCLFQHLDNPVVARIHHCASKEKRPYLVLEYIEGQTLAEHVVQHGPLSPEDWLEICWPLARALQAMHGRAITHRSLRPSAVLLWRTPAANVARSGDRATTGDASRWRVKLLDAGLSLKRTLIHACAGNPASRVQTALGRGVARTIAFAPFEVVGRPKGQVWVGERSDVYSFGKLCAFALTGRPDPAGGDLAPLSEAWRQLLADCTAWTINDRPEHFGLVLDRLAHLPDAGDRVRRIEHGLHEIAIAEYSAALDADANDATALVNRGNAYARQGELDKALADFTMGLTLRPEDASLYLQRAFAHERKRAHDAALADYTEALRLEPRNAAALHNRGLAYAQKNDYDRALADYTEALRLDPDDSFLTLHRGNAYLGKAAYTAAIADFSATIRLDPDNPWALGNRGKTYLLLGDPVRAIADFTRLLQLEPNNIRALCDRAAARTALSRYRDALADFTAALALEPSPALHNDRGLTYLALRDFDAALTDFTEAIALAPDNVVSHVLRGDVYAHRRDFDAALADLAEALRLEPESASSWFHRGNIHARRGAHDEALADYDRALELQPNHAAAFFQRGNVHAERGVWDAAIADYTAALGLTPGDTASYTNRGNAYCSLGDHERALADYSAALELDPADAATWCNRANTYARLRDHDCALADYTEALRLDPANVQARTSRGNVHADKGDFAAAVADFTRAIGIDPAHAPAYTSRGNVSRHKGDFAAALADYSEALRRQPDDVFLYHNRGRIHALMGHYEQAIADNLEALRLAPDDASTCNNLAWLWATSPRPEHRQPDRAVEYARQACERTQWQIAGFLDTLAVACAAAGQFVEAIAFQRRAIELAAEQEKAEYRSRLELYEAGRVYEVPSEPLR